MFRPLLQRRDTFPALLLLVGLAGMIRHFTTRPAPATTPPEIAHPSDYRAPAFPAFRPSSPDVPEPTAASQDLRRQLREFIIPFPGVKSLPVPDALAILQNHWLALPHMDSVGWKPPRHRLQPHPAGRRRGRRRP